MYELFAETNMIKSMSSAHHMCRALFDLPLMLPLKDESLTQRKSSTSPPINTHTDVAVAAAVEHQIRHALPMLNVRGIGHGARTSSRHSNNTVADST